MTLEIHAVMQNADDLNSLFCNRIKNIVTAFATNMVTVIPGVTRPDLLALQRIRRNFIKALL